MPKLGNIKKSKYYHKFIWVACIDCGKERWVHLLKGKPVSIRCNSCATKQRKGSKNNNWRGGRRKDGKGYIYIVINSTNFFASMRSNRGYVFEHRLIMAQHLGRCLTSNEIVHHINGIKDDNRIENLQLIDGNGKHISNYFKERR